MKPLSDLSIRWRVLLAISGCSLLGLLLMAVLFVTVERASLREQKQGSVSIAARMIAERSNAAVMFGDATLVQESLGGLALDGSMELACVYTATDEVLGSYVRDAGGKCPPVAPAVGNGFARDHFEAVEPIGVGGEEVGRLLLRSDLQALNRQLERLLAIGLLCAVGVGVLLVMASIGIGRALTAPILALKDAALSIASEPGRGQRVTRTANNEIGELVDSFNHMVETIEDRDRALQESKEGLEFTVEERTRELSSANRELEAFSYSVSHDLRAPLRSIDGFSLALLEDAAERLAPEDLAYLQRIRAAAQKMGRLIDSLLDLSRVARKSMGFEAVDLGELAREVSGELCEQYAPRRIEIRIGEGLQAQGDRDLLRIALQNLLGNACKYTGNVEHAVVEFGRTEAGGKQVFFVRDNGAGFDMQYAARLFGAFQRLHRAEEFEGTGIGLATVARIIARHGGEIWAEAAPGEGATFYLSLPLRAQS